MAINRLIHLLLRSIDGIRRKPWLHFLSLFTLAAAFLSFTATLTAAVNLDSILARWIGTAELTIYLKEGVNTEESSRLQQAISQLKGVARVETITPATAKERFAQEIGDLGDMARTLPDTTFPATMDIHLSAETSRNLDARRTLAARLQKVALVDQVELYDDLFERLSALSLVGRLAAWGLGFIALVVAILVVTAVVRASVNARTLEIKVMGLVGATERYVRIPFLLEGALETTGAMLVALLSLHFLINSAETLAGELMPLVGVASLMRLESSTCIGLIGASAIAGLIGARISLRGLTHA